MNISKDFELMCATGTVGKLNRHVAVFVVYLPPSMPVPQAEKFVEGLANEIAAVKIALRDPVVIVCGDMNGKKIEEAFVIDDSIHQVITGPTRGASTLDLIFTNINDSINATGVMPPLETEDGQVSDHGCVLVEAKVPNTRDF